MRFWYIFTSERGHSREVHTQTHLEDDEGYEAQLPLEWTDPTLVRTETSNDVTTEVQFAGSHDYVPSRLVTSGYLLLEQERPQHDGDHKCGEN